MLRLGLGHGGGGDTERGNPGCHPRSYPSPLRFARAVTDPSHASPALRLGPETQATHRIRAADLRLGLIVALYVIAELGAKSKIPANIGPFLGVVLGLALLAHIANRWLAPDANAVILPLAALLNGIGYVVIARWNPPHARDRPPGPPWASSCTS